MGASPSKSTIKYRVYAATTYDYFGGGTDNWVSMEMIGENGQSTGLIKLKNPFENNFEPGKTDVFDLQPNKDVGLPLLIRIELNGKMDAWACRDIVVKYRNEVITYPVHDWIEKEITVAKAEALTFVQSKHAAIKAMRLKEVKENKLRFAWVTRPTAEDIGWRLPRYVQNTDGGAPPSFFAPTTTRTKNLVATGFQAVYNQARVAFEDYTEKLETLDDYALLYKYLQNDDDPAFYSRWRTDEEFGFQQMNGISPLSYERCTELPSGCQISGSHLVGILAEGKSLEEEIKAGKVYIADYSKVFQGITRNKNSKGEDLYCPDAVCLFYVNPEENFVPVAIQLVPDDEDTIFTPKDTEDDWLLAKMYFRVAVGNLHQWYHHFLMTHNVMEPFAVSTFRCFPRCHPLYKLLRPHLQTVTAINDPARKALIPPSSGANQTLAIAAAETARRMFKDFTLADLVIPEVLKKKGLDDPKTLPKNYYRDDSLELWGIIRNFVENIVKNYYSSDEEVAADDEVQDFANDLVREGFGWQDGNSRGLPESIESIEKLIDLCTVIIFTCSAQHAAVNFGQYETYKFMPNSPGAMRLPPHKRGEATSERIMASLPDAEMAMTLILLTHLLSSYSPDEIYIGNYPDKYFNEPEVTMIIDNYKKDLRKFSAKIKTRNEGLESPYIWLLPEKVPNSIAI